MDAALRLGLGHPLHPVYTRFEFETGIGARSGDGGDDLLVAAVIAFARRDYLDPPALDAGIALIHAEEVTDENRCLVTAGAGPDFKDDIALIRRVLGQEQDLEL